MREQVQWTAPSPLWSEAADASHPSVRHALQQPSILRFNNDAFMDEFMTMLETDPSRLGGYLVQPETWRGPSPTPEPIEALPAFVRKLDRWRVAANRTLNGTDTFALARQQSLASGSTNSSKTGASLQSSQPLKLYQPAHLRYYLVTACLVCRRAGLPDHALDTNRAERASYVLRRLLPNARSAALPPEEYAFVQTSQGNGWQKLSGATDALVAGEERLPLFAVNYIERDNRRRRLFAGMIPVGKREAYMGAGAFDAASGRGSAQSGTPKTARKIHFRMQVSEPWKSLLERADSAAHVKNESEAAQQSSPKVDIPLETATLVKNSREQIQTLSWYILLDCAKYFERYLPNVWRAINGEASYNDLTNAAERTLYNTLGAIVVPPLLKSALTNVNDPDRSNIYTPGSIAPSLRDALKQVADPSAKWEEKLESVAVNYDRKTPDPAWPTFLFPLADPVEAAPLPPAAIDPPPDIADESGEAFDLDPGNLSPSLVEKQERIDKLVALVVRALPLESSEAAPPPPLAFQSPLETGGAGQFVIRCVYERPLCGPLDPPVVSEPSLPFQLAGFFDPDAPARPIRIALPIDTTPAGLRKFDKNTAFMISDALCGQIQRMKGITFGDLVRSVLPWPFHKDLSSKVPQMGPCRDKGKTVELGMICTLSIPIITICALILLMVIVALFDFIFKWIPYFIMCFPLPGFKSKK